jgi:aldehyde:ferredoxin oxidoreductase
MDGYAGKVLIADLTDKSFEIRELDREWARQFLGGSALGARYLYDLMPGGRRCLLPRALWDLSSGPTTMLPRLHGRALFRRLQIARTGWLERHFGGWQLWAFYEKAGFDAVFVRGISKEPVYLLLDDGKVEFRRRVISLWGKTVSETEAAIKEELGDTRVSTALIGPGGERLSNMGGRHHRLLQSGSPRRPGCRRRLQEAQGHRRKGYTDSSSIQR